MLKKIINSCQYVSDHSQWVKINMNHLDKFVNSIQEMTPKHWLSDSPYQLLELPVEKIINFLLLFQSIDFCFWGDPKWTIETSNGKEDGSIALMYALLQYVKDQNTTDFSQITKEAFLQILKGNVEIPLWEKRYEIIKNVSQIVNEKMNGNFYESIKYITTDEELLATIIRYFPNFKDESMYQGKPVYLYKLAQLLTSDILHIRELKEKIAVDYSHLVGCADYKIPQVMRALGILEYNETLANMLDQKQEIEKHSEYEVEIRANMLMAIHIMEEKLNHEINAIDINDYIWGQGRNKALVLKPYHLTRTINY